MIITISGKPGSGKSSVAKLIAKKLDCRHYSMGDLQKEIAEKRKISLLELGKLEEKDPSTDREIDQRQIKLGKEEDNFIIDSRLGFHFIPNSVKIFLTADLKTRANRIFKDKIRKEHNPTIKKTMQNLKTREQSEAKRFKKYYNLNPNDKKHYDLVIDSSKPTIEEVTEKIICHIKQKALNIKR